MNYGLPYKGSKSRIAPWVIDNLPPAETFVDLFAGGCAMTYAAMLSGNYTNFIANDIGDALKLRQEKLFVQKRFEADYYRQMGRLW